MHMLLLLLTLRLVRRTVDIVICEHASSALTRPDVMQGDWGTQFGMLVQNMQDQGGLDHVGNNSISDLLALYRRASCCPRADPAVL